LRNIKTGWNVDLRRPYLSWWNGARSSKHPSYVVKWFEDAGIHYNNGASFSNYMSHAHEEAKFSMSPDEIVALSDVLAAYSGNQSYRRPSGPPRKVVKAWTTADLQPLLNQVGRGRNFSRGKQLFTEAQCIACHRYGDQGGAIGPDLTAVATRFKRQDILESITEPSKVVSEQYMNTAIQTADGRVFVGRIVNETADKIVLRPDPLETATVTIPKSQVESRKLSKISPMPEGLINTFNKDEILDLLAYLESLNDPSHPDFRR
jgi:putative heme-binding domain-containing protein